MRWSVAYWRMQACPAREDETVAVRPVRVRRVVVHHLGVEEVRERRERHGGAGMPGVRLLDGIHRERADGVDRQLLDVSLRATKLLVETLLPFPRRTICLCPRLPRMEHLAEWRVRRPRSRAVPGPRRRRRAATPPRRRETVTGRASASAIDLDPARGRRGARRRWPRPPRPREAGRRSPRSEARRPRAPPGGCRAASCRR